jgi:hypothetical protein
MPLELNNAPGHVRHLNIRKEGDEEKILAVDLKIEMEATEDDLAAFDPTLRSALFKQNEPVLRFPLMGPVTWSGEMQHMDIEVSGLAFRNLVLKKFVLEPYINGKSQKCVRILCSTAIAPSGNQVALLAELVQDDVSFTVQPQPALDLEPTLGDKIMDGLVAKGATKNADGSLDMTPIMPRGLGGTVTIAKVDAPTKKRAPPKATKKPRKT